MSKYDRIVVTGIGTLTSIGNNVNDYWQSLINGVSGANIIENFDAPKFKTRFACQVKNFDPLQYMDKKDVRKMDPVSYTHLTLPTTERV